MKLFEVLMDETKGADAGAAGGRAAGAGDAGAGATAGAAGDAGKDAAAGDAGKAAAGAAGDAGKGADKSVADGGDAGKAGDSGKAAAAAGDASKGVWPEDWLTRVSKGDEKAAKQLGRYASPEAMAEAHLALKRRMDSGEFKAVLPKNATEADLKAWRADNGIPEKADGYDLKGVKIGADEKPVVDALLQQAHAANYTPEQTRAAVDFYQKNRQQKIQQRLEKDETERSAALDALASEWGGSFARNKNLIGNVLSIFPEKVRESVMSARLPDGTLLFNNVDAIRGFVAMELRNNPAGIVVPAGDGELGKSMLDEYNAILKVKNEDRTKYNKDKTMNAREQVLIEAMIKQGIMDDKGNIVQQKKAA